MSKEFKQISTAKGFIKPDLVLSCSNCLLIMKFYNKIVKINKIIKINIKKYITAFCRGK